MPPRLQPDPLLLFSLLSLLGLGLVMVFSASAPLSVSNFGNPYHFLIRQALFLAVSLGIGYAILRLNIDWGRWAGPGVWVALGLLVLTLIPGVGVEVNHSQRWLPLGPVRLQASEFFKLAMLLFTARYVVALGTRVGEIRRGLAPLALVLGTGGVLLLMEPDMGAFVVSTAIVGGILFLGGLPWRLVASVGAIGALGFAWLATEPYRLARITAFQNPWADPYGSGFQLIQSLIAFGRGGITGVGLGESIQKQFYLPEAHTDFILAVIGEELGLVGVLLVMALFVLLCARIFTAARQAAARGWIFDALVAHGVMIWVAVQTLANVGVNLGALPTKGLTLPLMSYGGSSLVASAIAMGWVLRLSHRLRTAPHLVHVQETPCEPPLPLPRFFTDENVDWPEISMPGLRSGQARPNVRRLPVRGGYGGKRRTANAAPQRARVGVPYRHRSW